MKLVLRPEAEHDLEDIRVQSLILFGRLQAARYQEEMFLAMEGLTQTVAHQRERPELGDGIRFKRHKAHVILYRVTETEVVILRVRHDREDWLSDD
jgi:toxin ParE1/3/4